METLTSESFLVASGGEPRTRTALLLEAIALRHQIAVLERRGTSSPVLSPLGSTVLGLVLALVAPMARQRAHRQARKRCCAGAVRAGQCFGDIDPGVAGAADARGFPEKSVF
jgi:hypothetical protein